MNNPEKKFGTICITCNKKYYYREAMRDLLQKLEIGDNAKLDAEKLLDRTEN